MAYAYTDEELDRLYPELPDDGRGGWSRLLNAVYRLRCERDEARKAIAWHSEGAHHMTDGFMQLKRERDEARRVARRLGKLMEEERAWLVLDEYNDDDIRTALAYPEVKP